MTELAPRLTNDTLQLDLELIRRGWFTDRYFLNISRILEILSQSGATISAGDQEDYPVGDARVEMQWFTRRPGATIVAGIDAALVMLRECTGHWQGDQFVNTSDRLEVWAVQEGDKVEYGGDPEEVAPVLRVRGPYRFFANLETTTLGVLTRASRVATNCYNLLVAANGKPVLFFPARYDLPETQAIDGYAYQLAVQVYNRDHGTNVAPFISTDAQGAWWGGKGGGTIPHAAIASFLGDTPATTLAFAEIMPPELPRIALTDFHNDNVRESLAVLAAMFARYRELKESGNDAEAEKFRLFGVRLDTSNALRDVSVPYTGDPGEDLGVTPRLVQNVRAALDSASESWDLPEAWREPARDFCRAVKIVVSGGFDVEKIARFESGNVPVDVYAVGSAAFDNHGPTLTDFTADVVRIYLNGEWVPMAKVGRRPGQNPSLHRVW